MAMVETHEAKKKRQHRKNGNKDVHGSSLVIHIPEDILVEIFIRLPLRTIIRCKQVSKSWNRLISDETFPVPTVTNLPMTHLLCCRQDHRPIRDWERKSKKIKNVDFSTICIEEIHKSDHQTPGYSTSPLNMYFLPWNKNNRSLFSILDSCNGLILCLFLRKNYIVVNPSNQTWILLPPDRSKLCYDHQSIFVFDPKVSKHFKVVFVYGKYNHVKLAIFSSESGEWTISPTMLLQVWDRTIGFNSPSVHCAQQIVDGTLYLGSQGKVFGLSIEDYTTRIIKLPQKFGLNCGKIDIFKGRLQLFQFFRQGSTFCEDTIRIWELQDWLTSDWKLMYTISFEFLIEGFDLSCSYMILSREPCFHKDKYAFFMRVGANKIIYYELNNGNKKIITLEDFYWADKLLPLSPCWVDLFDIGKNISKFEVNYGEKGKRN